MSELENLKVGDKVLVSRSGWGRHLEISTVEKIHKLHIVVDGTKYSKRSGSVAGARWSSLYLRPYNEKEWLEYQTEVQVRNMRSRLANFNWNNCDVNLLYAVHVLLPDEEKKA